MLLNDLITFQLSNLLKGPPPLNILYWGSCDQYMNPWRTSHIQRMAPPRYHWLISSFWGVDFYIWIKRDTNTHTVAFGESQNIQALNSASILTLTFSISTWHKWEHPSISPKVPNSYLLQSVLYLKVPFKKTMMYVHITYNTHITKIQT